MKTEKIVEKVVNAEKMYKECLTQKRIISVIDKHIEKLSSQLPDKITATVKTHEKLSVKDTISLPIKVFGTMLGIGRHKERFYPKEELISAIEKYANKKIPIKVDHRDDEVGSIVGAIDKLFWNPETESIDYEGHINDETQARNILDGVVNNVSASVLATKGYDETFGFVATDLEFTELSLVVEGAYKGNTLRVVK